jgi:adenylate cyclase class IV
VAHGLPVPAPPGGAAAAPPRPRAARVLSAPRRNLELKAVDPAPPRTLAAALELDGAEDQGVLQQRDTYFHAVQGRLKLREFPGAAAELISYRRADRDGPKVSNYRIVPVLDPEATAQALADALGVRAVVEKARRLILWRGVRIHLDAVAGLGSFVELEAVSDAPGGLVAEEAKIAQLRTELSITDDLLIADAHVSLIDLGVSRMLRSPWRGTLQAG